MEATMYEDANNQTTLSGQTGENVVKALKRSMTLDLNSPGKPSAKRSKLSAAGTVLASPDLNMLKLASPELERMIIQQNGMVTTTPTPTQFICPKYVTEEQEAYARGFVDALEELHRKKEDITTVEKVMRKPSETNGGSHLTVLQPARSLPGFSAVARATTSGQSQYQVSIPINYQVTYAMPHHSNSGTVPQDNIRYSQMGIVNPKLNQIKEEPQTVPCTPPPPALSVSPINLESQEVHKSERKRARNRIAARKCRHRKLERISRLEDKVAQLKGQNSELATNATKLRDQVCALKQQILDHVKNGCQVLMSQNLTF